MDKPKAMVHPEFSAADSLREMINADSKLYDVVTKTPVFAFHFSQLANKATHYDYLNAQNQIERPEVTALIEAVQNARGLARGTGSGIATILAEALDEYIQAKGKA